MVNKVYIEDAEDLMRESKTYRKILEHRRKCSKWGKEFCLECFGGGLTLFTKNLSEELYFKEKEGAKLGSNEPPATQDN